MTGVMAMWKTEMGAGGLSDLTSQKGNLHRRTACRDGTPFRGSIAIQVLGALRPSPSPSMARAIDLPARTPLTLAPAPSSKSN